MSTTKPVLFFSKSCNKCHSLWTKLSTENKLDGFIKICVDNNPKIPPNIKEVPAILIKNRPLITGPAIPMFLNSYSPQAAFIPDNNTQNTNTKLSNPSGAIPHISTSTNGLNSIYDFNAVEMSSSWSDSYSFIQDQPSPMNFCYQFLGSDEKVGQGQSQGNTNDPNASSSRLQKMNDFEKRLDNLRQERNMFR
jgi:hypothetical protein